MRSVVFAIPLSFVAALAAKPSFAFPHIDVTQSETLSTAPLRVRTTFTIALVGYEPGSWFGFIVVSSGAGPVVHLYECQAPAIWTCGNYPTGSSDNAYFDINFGTSEDPWGGPPTFSIVTDQAVPCVRFIFQDPLLGKVPTPHVNNNYVVDGCLQVDMPTAAQPATWGSVKSLYR